MKKTFALIAALLALASLPAFAQKTTTMQISREKNYSASTKTVTVWYQGELNIGYGINGKMNFKMYDYGEFGYGGFKSHFSGPFISTIHGVHITKWAFAGLGLGFHYACGKADPYNAMDITPYLRFQGWRTLTMPIFFNMKGYYPFSDDLQVYISLSFGGNPVLTCGIVNAYNDEFAWDEEEVYKVRGGYYGEYGVGVNYKRLNFSLGLQQQTMKLIDKYELASNWYVKGRVNAFYLKVGYMF